MNREKAAVMAFELGIYHFGELAPDPVTGRPRPLARGSAS
jgi:hypothetical protein